MGSTAAEVIAEASSCSPSRGVAGVIESDCPDAITSAEAGRCNVGSWGSQASAGVAASAAPTAQLGMLDVALHAGDGNRPSTHAAVPIDSDTGSFLETHASVPGRKRLLRRRM